MNLPGHIKEKIRACSNYYSKADTLNKYLIDYFVKNNLYKDIEKDYFKLVVNSNNSNTFIEIVDKINQDNIKNIIYKNETHSLIEWCRILNLNYSTVFLRYCKYPANLDYVFSNINHKHISKYLIEYNNETHSLVEWSKILNIQYKTLLARYKNKPDDLDYVFRQKNKAEN